LSDVVIKAEGLGKSYRIGHQGHRERYTALRDVMASGARRALGRTRRLLRGELDLVNEEVEEFWALRDVSFEVKQGEVLGIVGRNGAGKSTLLKVLSRITEPATGRVTLRGRVASLLEVGTGFHPELTGRENIFLNGAILGMSRTEIKCKFDEIVAFAEVEKFLDTPVKRYSSGMYVRLAFAVAAHLEPEILVVDEVLAVGDAEFQKKCLGKMQDVSRVGRTVLFVSHNMSAITTLCGRGIVLEHGLLKFDGKASAAVGHYLEANMETADACENRQLSKTLNLAKFSVSPRIINSGERISFTVILESTADEQIFDLALLIHAPDGSRAALLDLRSAQGPFKMTKGSQLRISAEVTAMPFVENDFANGLYINSGSVCRSFMNLITHTVLPMKTQGGVVAREAQFRGLVELPFRIQHNLTPFEAKKALV
jgi:lipopolysaccharide transport system ATP-binding protein